jgi:predicted DNA-binding transcriptional regulator AlpA
MKEQDISRTATSAHKAAADPSQSSFPIRDRGQWLVHGGFFRSNAKGQTMSTAAESRALPQLLGPDDLTELFGVHKVTLTDWVRRGYLPRPIRIGAQFIRWRRDEIEKILAGDQNRMGVAS